jgi:hypothetical protein
MDLGTACDRCARLWFPFDRGWLHLLDVHVCPSCVTPRDERAVLLATATATLHALAMEGDALDHELHGLAERVGEEYARQLDRSQELRRLRARVED